MGIRSAKSLPKPGRTVADTAADVRAICAELGIERLVTWGHSGGGPPALACAALLPDLVTAAAALASPAPYDVDGLDYFAGMDQDNVDDTRGCSSPTKTALPAGRLDRHRGDCRVGGTDPVAASHPWSGHAGRVHQDG